MENQVANSPVNSLEEGQNPRTHVTFQTNSADHVMRNEYDKQT